MSSVVPGAINNDQRVKSRAGLIGGVRKPPPESVCRIHLILCTVHVNVYVYPKFA